MVISLVVKFMFRQLLPRKWFRQADKRGTICIKCKRNKKISQISKEGLLWVFLTSALTTNNIKILFVNLDAIKYSISLV